MKTKTPLEELRDAKRKADRVFPWVVACAVAVIVLRLTVVIAGLVALGRG